MSEAADDVQWVVRCLEGDACAFEPLVERYQRGLFAVAMRLLGNYEDARDATQNAFIRAYEHLETFDPERRFFSWICRIVVNESLNLKRARPAEAPLADRAGDAADGFDAVVGDERRRELQRALGRLPEDQRVVIVLRYFAELSYEEIGAAVGVPQKTVKSRLFEARQRLAETIQPFARGLT